MKKQITIMLLLLALLFASQAMMEKTKMNYTGKVSWEEIYLPPSDDGEVLFLTEWRCYLLISRSDGEVWELEIPSGEEVKNLSFDESNFEETDDGFLLHFNWGGGRYFWSETFFFKESDGEPCLYKIESRLTEYTLNKKTGDFDDETDTKVRMIAPLIKLSDFNEKLPKLLGQ